MTLHDPVTSSSQGRLRRILPLVPLVLISACASGPALDPAMVIQKVETPVAVRCRPALGAAPVYPDTDAALRAAPGLYDRVRLLAAGRLMRMAREAQTAAALAECAG